MLGWYASLSTNRTLLKFSGFPIIAGFASESPGSNTVPLRPRNGFIFGFLISSFPAFVLVWIHSLWHLRGLGSTGNKNGLWLWNGKIQTLISEELPQLQLSPSCPYSQRIINLCPWVLLHWFFIICAIPKQFKLSLTRGCCQKRKTWVEAEKGKGKVLGEGPVS